MNPSGLAARRVTAGQHRTHHRAKENCSTVLYCCTQCICEALHSTLARAAGQSGGGQGCVGEREIQAGWKRNELFP